MRYSCLAIEISSFELLMWSLVMIVRIVQDYMVLWIHCYDDTNHIFYMLA
jgi:hypothetical protein